MAGATTSRMARTIVRTSLNGLALASVRLIGHQRTVRGVDHAAKWVRHMHGQLEGLDYRLRGREPDTEAGDPVLTARVRSQLGPLLRRLDLPHLDVTVDDGVALLRGGVARGAQADEIIAAVRQVPGVRDVDARLHIGLTRGDTRPSAGHDNREASTQLRRLAAAAEAAGVAPAQAAVALRVFLLRLPSGERDHVVGHLPTDVRQMVDRVVVRADVLHIRDVEGLVAIVADVADLADDQAQRVLEGVLRTLAELVPEEVADISAVLPAGLGQLWSTSTTATDDEGGRHG
jgi:uncharacterized protein (DUF2267 family)